MRHLLLSVLLVPALTGCAAIMHGRGQEVPVNTVPDSAAVTTDCGNGIQASGQTPVTVRLKRGADVCRLTLSKEGYEDATVAFAKKVSGWIWGNLLFGGIPDAIIDATTGAMYNRVPDSVQVNLTKK